MHQTTIILTLCVLLCTAGFVRAQEATPATRLWYEKPAKSWQHAEAEAVVNETFTCTGGGSKGGANGPWGCFQELGILNVIRHSCFLQNDSDLSKKELG
jgi:hypothetical protein